MLDDYVQGVFIRGVQRRTGEETVLVAVRLTHTEAIALIETADQVGKKAKEYVHDLIIEASFTTDRKRHDRRDEACEKLRKYKDGTAKT